MVYGTFEVKIHSDSAVTGQECMPAKQRRLLIRVRARVVSNEIAHYHAEAAAAASRECCSDRSKEEEGHSGAAAGAERYIQQDDSDSEVTMI